MRLPVVVLALVVQIGSLASVFAVFHACAFFGVLLPAGLLLILHSGLAVILSRILGLPSWWLPIQGLFAPALLSALSLHLPPGIFLAGFILLSLIFFSNPRERVPLYLSNETVFDALSELMQQHCCRSFLDLGCGLGGVLARLAVKIPGGRFDGVESAPLPFLVSWLRLRRKGNACVRYGNLWKQNLAAYDLVYAFLSPEPMADLWLKARKEMGKGSLFVSNSFGVPGCEPDETLQLGDSRGTRLFIWVM